MKKYEVKFKYADMYSNLQWRNQQGTFFAKDEYDAKRKCIELYGLGVDCDYEITSVVKMQD